MDWSVSSETGIQKYEIQKAGTGSGFIKLGETAARRNNTAENYQWMDDSPYTGVNYYRIRVVHEDGSISLSKVVSIIINEEKAEMKVYPNPVQNNEIRFLMVNAEKGKYAAKLFDVKGRMILSREIDYNGGTGGNTLQFERPLTPGVYFFQLINSKVKMNQNIIII